jgi:hypothetical protein
MEVLAMSRTAVIIRLVMRVVVATTIQAAVAEEPTGSTPPARSIHEWNPTPGAAPAATPAATPAPPAATPATPVATPATPAAPARSIREWMAPPAAAPAAAPAASPCSTQTVAPAVLPAVRTAASASPTTISITSTLREGKLVVVLDGVPIFNEKFRKPMLFISQTTTWDPVQIPAGQHRLEAKVYGTKKTYLSAQYDLNVPRTKASALRFVMKGDKLTVQVAS